MGIQGVCKDCGFSPTLDYCCLRCTEKERDALFLKIEAKDKALEECIAILRTCRDYGAEEAEKIARAALTGNRKHHENCDVNDLIIKGKPCNCIGR